MPPVRTSRTSTEEVSIMIWTIFGIIGMIVVIGWILARV